MRIRFFFLAVVVMIAVAAVGLLLPPRPSNAEQGSPRRDPAKVTAELRARLLHGTATEFSIAPVASV